MATESLIININEKGGKVVVRNIKDIGKQSQLSSGGVNILKRALGGLSAILAVRQVTKYGESWKRVTNILKSSLSASQSLATAQKDVIDIARSSRGPLEQVSKLYAGISASSAELGASQRDIAKFTQLASKAISVQGSSAGEATGALLQLRQAIGGAVIQAQEFNSLIDGARPLLEAVANGSDRFGGSVNKLREEVREGTVTSKEFFEAALAGASIVEDRFGKTTATIAQSMTKLNNSLTVAVGTSKAYQAVSNALSNTLVALSENLNQVATVATVAGAALGARLFTPLILNVLKANLAMKGLAVTMAILGGPVTIIAAAIAGLTTYLALFADEIRIPGTELATLADVASVVFNRISTAVDEMVTFVSGKFSKFVDVVRVLAPEISRVFSDMLADIGINASSIADVFIKPLDIILGMFIGLKNAILVIFDNLDVIIKNPLDAMIVVVVNSMNGLNDIIIGVLNTIIRAANSVSKLINVEIPEITIPEIQIPAGINQDVRNMGEDIANAFSDGLNSSVVSDTLTNIASTVSNGISSILKEADEQAKRNKITEGFGAGIEVRVDKLAAPGGALGANNERADALAKINLALAQEARLLNESGTARNVMSTMLRIENGLRRDGITLSGAEADNIQTQLESLEVLKTRSDVLQAINGEQIAFTQSLAAINALLEEGRITQEQVSKTLMESNPTLFDNTRTEFESLAQTYQDTLSTIDQLRQADVISERTAAKARLQAYLDQQNGQLDVASDFFGSLSQLQKSENSKIAAIGRAAAITQATIQTYQAATGAYAAMAGIPYIGPGLGAAAAAAAIVAGLANVQKIASARALGGTANPQQLLRVGENNRPEIFRGDSGKQFFIPPERGRVEPLKARADVNPPTGPQSINVPTPQVNVTSVNLVDPSLLEDFLSTPEGDRVLVNRIARNASRIGPIVSRG